LQQINPHFSTAIIYVYNW